MTIITRHALRVYSSLSALKGSNGDVLDALVPFFDPILKLLDGKIFEPKLIVAGVRKMYRWNITREIVEQFIPRLTALGLLEKHGTAGKVTYIVRYRDTVPSDESGRELVEAFDAIIDEFASFPQVVTDLLNYSRTRDELADILIRFLVISNVLFQGNGSLPNVITTEVSELACLPEGGRPLLEYDKYMAARFVQYLLKNRPDLAPHLSRIASVGLLTEVVDDFVRPTDRVSDVDLTILVDAPLALDYLGLSGKEIQSDIKPILDDLRSIGCKISVFPVTCAEMSHNLRALLDNSPSNRHGYTHSAMISGEVLQDYVVAVANDPEAALIRHGIEVKDANLTHFPNSHKFFTSEMHDDFMSDISWGKDISAREHDADCLTLLMRLRDGKHSRDLLKSRYVFITRNVAFARRSREYCIRARQLFENQEGPVVHQRDLAMITWLRTGLGAADGIPRMHLVAHCNRVLQVRPELTEAVKTKLRAFSQEKLDQYELLLLDQRSVRKLADATLNDETLVTGENAGELLELMRQATVAELKTQFDEDLEAEKKKYAQARRELNVKHTGDVSERDERLRTLQAMLDTAEREKETLATQQEQAMTTMLATVNGMSRSFRMGTAVTIFLLGALVLGNEFFHLVSETNWAWRGFGIVAAIVGAYEWMADHMDLPTFGFRNVANVFTRWALKRELRRRGMSWLIVENFPIVDGSVQRPHSLIEDQGTETEVAPSLGG